MENKHIQSTEDIILAVETTISEGFQSTFVAENQQEKNAFGRSVMFNNSSDLSFLSGLASTGLRCAALVGERHLTANANQLASMARQHLATVVHCVSPGTNIQSIADAGWFQLSTSTAQESVDFTLIAHRIAELSLLPGICEHAATKGSFTIPTTELITSYLGNPDNYLACPTPSQGIIFGTKRRRVVNWFSPDYPTTNGSLKKGRAKAYETAANNMYFHDHLAALAQQAFDEFNQISGSSYSPVVSYHTDDANHLVLTQGEAFLHTKSGIDAAREKGQKVGCLNLSLIRPFPAEALANLVQGKESITVLESAINGSPANGPIYTELLAMLQENNITLKVFSARHGSKIFNEDIALVIDNMISGTKQKYHVGIDFTHESSKFPKHEVLLDNIKRGYPEIQNHAIKHPRETNASSVISDKATDLPKVIRQYRDQGPAYTRLSRFFDDVGYFHKTDNKKEIVSDPFQAVPVIPSATAIFANRENQRESVPQFISENCTGCGDCFVNCPHSAIPPIVIGLEDLIKAGADIATKNGHAISKITPHVKNIALLSSQAIHQEDINNTTSDFLQAGFDELVQQTGLKEEKLTAVQADFEAILSAVKSFPSSVTDTFFNQPDAQDKGSGALFSLAVDPYACTGCGVCAQSCDTDALSMVSQTPEVVHDIHSTYELWENLPDTSGDIISRMLHDDNYDSFASILLSRNFYMTMAGGSKNENKAPSKGLLHLILAATESIVQPKIIAQIKQIDELGDLLNENIHKKLAEALPKENFDTLEKVMKNFQGQNKTFDEVISKMGDSELMKQIDSNDVQRKIELAHDLKNLKWVLSEGPSGAGRSRYGMALAGTEDWEEYFPYNNFTAPTAIHYDGSSPELALGLFRGQLRYLLDNIKIMRRAKLEAKDKYNPSQHDTDIANLSWSDLADDEKELVAPIILAGEIDTMSERSLSGLSQLLSDDWPVKVILLDDAQVNTNENPSKTSAQKTSILINAVTTKNAFVMQGSMGNPSHLFNGILKGMTSLKPALFSIFSPAHNHHTAAPDAWPDLALIANSSRAFPDFLFSPTDNDEFFGSSIELEDNPSPTDNWHMEPITYGEGEDEKND